MALFDASALFDFTNYKHKSLFGDCTAVWQALSKLESYLNSLLLNVNPVNTENYPNVYFAHPEKIFLGKNVRVEAGVYIEGPCFIGDDCILRHGAYIRENVITGDHCVIGHGTELKNVILLDHVHIAHLSYCGDSIFGNYCNLGAGTKCANLRFDGKPINIHFQGQRYPTDRRKLGLIAGDEVQLGCNSVTNPGTILGKKCFLFPCTNFGGVAQAGSLIRQETKAITHNNR